MYRVFLQGVEQVQSRFSFRRSIGLRGHRRRSQTMPVLHQHVPEIAQPGRLTRGFLVQTSIQIGLRLVRLIGPLFTMEIHVRSAPRLVAAVLAPEDLVARPWLDQRPIHGEVLVAHQPLCFGFHLGEEPLRHILVQQANRNISEAVMFSSAVGEIPKLQWSQRESRLPSLCSRTYRLLTAARAGTAGCRT